MAMDTIEVEGVGAEMVFDIEGCFSQERLPSGLSTDLVPECAAAVRQDNAHTPITPSPKVLTDAPETRLQREVRLTLSNLQGYAYGAVSAHPEYGTPGSRPHVAGILTQMCAALRLRGLDARLCLPAASRGVSCGRNSTGGGGKCTAAPDRTCFFCSRLPYAVVLGGAPPPPPSSSTYSERSSQPGTQPLASGASEMVVVEPSLREIFRVAPVAPLYSAIVEALPEMWVGSPAGLLELANRMCDAMTLNFRLQGLDVPPWRRRGSVLARWHNPGSHWQLVAGCSPDSCVCPCPHVQLVQCDPTSNQAAKPPAVSGHLGAQFPETQPPLPLPANGPICATSRGPGEGPSSKSVTVAGATGCFDQATHPPATPNRSLRRLLSLPPPKLCPHRPTEGDGGPVLQPAWSYGSHSGAEGGQGEDADKQHLAHSAAATIAAPSTSACIAHSTAVSAICAQSFAARISPSCKPNISSPQHPLMPQHQHHSDNLHPHKCGAACARLRHQLSYQQLAAALPCDARAESKAAVVAVAQRASAVVVYGFDLPQPASAC